MTGFGICYDGRRASFSTPHSCRSPLSSTSTFNETHLSKKGPGSGIRASLSPTAISLVNCVWHSIASKTCDSLIVQVQIRVFMSLLLPNGEAKLVLKTRVETMLVALCKALRAGKAPVAWHLVRYSTPSYLPRTVEKHHGGKGLCRSPTLSNHRRIIMWRSRQGTMRSKKKRETCEAPKGWGRQGLQRSQKNLD